MNKNINIEKSTTEDVIDTLNQTASKSEQFLEKNARLLGVVFAGLIVAALGYFAYLKYYQVPREKKAFDEMYDAENYFQKDSINAALKGSKGSYYGFTEIADEFGSTKAGNIAKYYAGVGEYKKGNYKKAIQYLDDFNTNEEAMKAIKYGVIGDANAQLKQNDAALNNYKKAAEASDLEFTKILYYKKAGILAMTLNKNKEALEYFETIAKKYPDSEQNAEISKFVERLKNTQ